MISDVEIKNTLNELNRYYSDLATSSEGQICASKLALLELCGWIEQSIDTFFLNFIESKNYSDPDRFSYYISKLDQVNGMGPENVRRIIMIAVGAQGLYDIEDKMSASGDISVLYTKLKTLSKKRNPSAHTAISGTMITYSSPSDIIADLHVIFPKLERLGDHFMSLCDPS